MKTKLFRALFLGVTLLSGLTLRADPALAGNAALKGQNLGEDDTKALLLGKKITLGDTRVVMVIAKTSPAQDAFLQAHVAMNTSQFQNHWRRLFMTGGGTAPKLVETEEAAAKLVAETPGGVSVVDSAKASGLTVLSQ